MDRNNTSFLKAVWELLHDPKPVTEYAVELEYHQRVVHQYFLEFPKIRGVLLYHDMGSGKSITSAAIADSLKDKYRVIVLSNKSLHDNYRENIVKMKGLTPDEGEAYIKKHYKFITLNAGNVRFKLADDEEDDIFADKLEALRVTKLTGSIIVVDEAHNLFNAIVNGGKNALAIYNIFMEAKNTRFIFLSGSPIINDPFEIVPMLNVCAGKMGNFTLFGNSYDEFYSHFVDEKGMRIKNAEKFINRIVGLVSYFRPSSPEFRAKFPTKLPMIMRIIPMQRDQFAAYLVARSKEKEEAQGESPRKRAIAPMAKPKGVSSTYRVRSRQISNCYMGETLISPKFEQMYKDAESEGFPLTVVYSQFVREGLHRYGEFLRARGFTEVAAIVSGDLPKEGAHRRFAYITGDVPFEQRAELIKLWNMPENAHGELLQCLMISSTGAEGLDLKRVRVVQIMEPFWNYARINQVIARAVRYRSHEDMPEEERVVQPYMYLSDYPEGTEKIEEPTTEISIEERATARQALVESFLNVLQRGSIDCPMHYTAADGYCYACQPTNEPLFVPELTKDMEMPNPCLPLRTTKIVVHKATIVLDNGESVDIFYSYIDDELTLYEFDEQINGYFEMDHSDPLYAIAYDQIYRRLQAKK